MDIDTYTLVSGGEKFDSVLNTEACTEADKSGTDAANAFEIYYT